MCQRLVVLLNVKYFTKSVVEIKYFSFTHRNKSSCKFSERLQDRILHLQNDECAHYMYEIISYCEYERKIFSEAHEIQKLSYTLLKNIDEWDLGLSCKGDIRLGRNNSVVIH